jgi:hypothetical protein
MDKSEHKLTRVYEERREVELQIVDGSLEPVFANSQFLEGGPLQTIKCSCGERFHDRFLIYRSVYKCMDSPTKTHIALVFAGSMLIFSGIVGAETWGYLQSVGGLLIVVGSGYDLVKPANRESISRYTFWLNIVGSALAIVGGVFQLLS